PDDTTAMQSSHQASHWSIVGSVARSGWTMECLSGNQKNFVLHTWIAFERAGTNLNQGWKVPLSVSLSYEEDETSACCHCWWTKKGRLRWLAEHTTTIRQSMALDS